MPCETCIVQAMCKDKHYKNKNLNKLTQMCLAVPDWDTDRKLYIKGLFECWINLGDKMSQELIRLKLNNRRITDGDTSISVPDQYIDFLFAIISTFQWIVNSTSWREGELYKFDSFEVKEKLKYTTHWLDNGK